MSVTSPLTLFASSSELARARDLLQQYKAGSGEGRNAWGNEDEHGIWKAKQRAFNLSLQETGVESTVIRTVVDSSIHPGACPRAALQPASAPAS